MPRAAPEAPFRPVRPPRQTRTPVLTRADVRGLRRPRPLRTAAGLLGALVAAIAVFAEIFGRFEGSNGAEGGSILWPFARAVLSAAGASGRGGSEAFRGGPRNGALREAVGAGDARRSLQSPDESFGALGSVSPSPDDASLPQLPGGAFPPGCRWREVAAPARPWDVRMYEYSAVTSVRTVPSPQLRAWIEGEDGVEEPEEDAARDVSEVGASSVHGTGGENASATVSSFPAHPIVSSLSTTSSSMLPAAVDFGWSRAQPAACRPLASLPSEQAVDWWRDLPRGEALSDRWKRVMGRFSELPWSPETIDWSEDEEEESTEESGGNATGAKKQGKAGKGGDDGTGGAAAATDPASGGTERGCGSGARGESKQANENVFKTPGGASAASGPSSDASVGAGPSPLPKPTLAPTPAPASAPAPGSAPHIGTWSTSLRSARSWSIPAVGGNASSDSPRTEVTCSSTACVYERLWYCDGKYYLLVDGDKPVEPWALGKNVHLNVLHVRDAEQFARSVQAKRLRGETLFIDYAYFIHPTAIGHWAEALLPLFSQLRLAAAQASVQEDGIDAAGTGKKKLERNQLEDGSNVQASLASQSKKTSTLAVTKNPRNASQSATSSAPAPSHGPPDQIVLLNLKRAHVMPWVRELLAASLGLSRHENLPPVVWQREMPSIWTQITAPLEGMRRGEWLLIDRALVMRDKDLGGPDRARVHGDAIAFRESVYTRYRIPARVEEREGELKMDAALKGEPSAPGKGKSAPSGGRGTPRSQPLEMVSSPSAAAPPALSSSPLSPLPILFLRKSSDRRVVNEPELLAALAQFGPVTVAEWSEDTPVAEQVRLVSSASVLVSVHTSALANVILLRPHSIVLELLHRNWLERRLDETFRDLSSGMGDVHHYAWRDLAGPGKGLYLDPRDARRFGNWTSKQCDSEECVEAHTRVDVRVDVPTVVELLRDRLQVIRSGASVAQAALPWPERHPEDIKTKQERQKESGRKKKKKKKPAEHEANGTTEKQRQSH